jgi:hypothetical protein
MNNNSRCCVQGIQVLKVWKQWSDEQIQISSTQILTHIRDTIAIIYTYNSQESLI